MKLHSSLVRQLRAGFQNFGTLVLLAAAFPFNCTIVLGAFLWNILRRSWWATSDVPSKEAGNAKNVLIVGARMTKTLHLARSFHAAGHRVILADTHKFWLAGNRFSRAVAGFYTVPDPAVDREGYITMLRAIAEQEKIDLFIPVAIFSVITYDSQDKPVLSGRCEFFHFDASITRILDDKFTFSEMARSFGLSVPKSFKITHPSQILDFDFSKEQHPYILKSIPYDPVRRLNLTKLPCASPDKTAEFVSSLPISQEHPWIMQEFIAGQEYCNHSTVRDGRVRLYCGCESSAFQVNYAAVNKPEIKQWVQQFAEALGLTGQLSFDFIQAVDGTVYAIECNPRTHSAITLFYNHPGVVESYLGREPLAEPSEPLPGSRSTYWLYHELWRLTEVRSLKQLRLWFNKIFQGKEAIFELDDPLPFLMVHHWQIPLLLLNNLRQLKGWIRIDFNIGELIEG